jgi:hypothetical protein
MPTAARYIFSHYYYILIFVDRYYQISENVSDPLVGGRYTLLRSRNRESGGQLELPSARFHGKMVLLPQWVSMG